MAEEEAQNGGSVLNGTTKEVTFSALKAQLIVDGDKVGDAVQFYKAAFGAEEVNRVNHPKRKAEQELPLILSAELKLGPTNFLVCGNTDDSLADPVKTRGGRGVFSVETEDVEAAVAKAVNAGAVSDGEVAEGDGACFGRRAVKLEDPYGSVWFICAPVVLDE